MNGWHYVKEFFTGNASLTASTFDGLNQIASANTSVIPISTGTGITIDSSEANARTFFGALDYAIQRTNAPESEIVMFVGLDVLSTIKTAANLIHNNSVFTYGGMTVEDRVQRYNGVQIVTIPNDPNNNTIIGFDDDSNSTASVYVCHLSSIRGLVGLKRGNWKFKEMDLAVGKTTYAMELPMGVMALQDKCVQRVSLIQRSTSYTPTT
jgi:hypothetical protein